MTTLREREGTARASLSPTRNSLLCAIPLVAAACLIIGVRAILGFQFPVPWPDETGFVSPAFNLAYTGSLFDPGLNPDRVMMWMPPGYMVLLAAVFRTAGYSFALVRWLSTAFTLVSLLLLARIAWRHTAGTSRVVACLAIGVAFASPYMLIDSNIARMESVLCCLALAALSVGLAGRPYIMAAIVAGSAFVHFNAVYFVPACVLWFGVLAWRRELRWPARRDVAALGVATIILAGYATYIWLNWSGFLADMRVQFSIKAFFGALDTEHPSWIAWCAVASFVAGALISRRLDKTLLIGAFGAGFVVMSSRGHEIWYDYGQGLGFALILVQCLIPVSTEPRLQIYARQGLAGAALVMAAVTGFRITTHMQEFLPTPKMFQRGFVSQSDLRSVRNFLLLLPPATNVDMGFTGMECFFLPELARTRSHWTLLQHAILQGRPYRRSDWRIACDSSDLAPAMRKWDVTLRRQGKDTGCKIMPGLDPEADAKTASHH